MADLLFEIERSLGHDGLQIFQDKIVIQGRKGKGEETIIPVKSIASVKTNRHSYDILGLQLDLVIQAGNEKYELKSLPKKDAEKAKEVLVGLI